MKDSIFFKNKFKTLKKPIPEVLEYAGVKHNNLIKNIKEDVSMMDRIEKRKDFDVLKNRLVYISLINRLDKILYQLELIDNL
jgi:hypothetical protein